MKVEAVLPVSIVNHVTKGVGRHKPEVSSQKLKDAHRWRIGAGVLAKLVVSLMPLVVILLSCQATNLDSPSSWNTYRNQRYDFEFPYPSNWLPFPMPDNRDGRAFRDPQNPNFEIRGWAANKLSGIETSSPNSTPKDFPESQQQNFTTQQGLTGKLQVEIGADTSLMTLTLSQGKVLYNWQGQCDSEQFANYYRFFYQVARQYRLPPPEEH